MTEKLEKPPKAKDDYMNIVVSQNGPYFVTGGVPLIVTEICIDDKGYCLTWREVKRYPLRERYALCRCGHSGDKPFCDGTHTKIHFDGTEAGDYGLHSEGADVFNGPSLILTDNKHLCVHAKFCVRAGGVWKLVRQSENPEARSIAIEEVSNCPSGRLVIRDNITGETIEPELEKSIMVVECPSRGEHGPLWVRGGIPIKSVDGREYEIRNRVTLCGCGRSKNKPFCDGSHLEG